MGMIDIGQKEKTLREAVAVADIYIKSCVISAIKKNTIPKGNVLEAARFAGILAGKETSRLIPLCHPISIDYIDIHFSLTKRAVKIKTTVRATTKTGVEMEAFVATSIAALTIYDMCKALDRAIVISDIKLLKKTGGKSGTYIRKD